MRGNGPAPTSQRPQEVEDGLSVAYGQGVEILDHRVGLRRGESTVGDTGGQTKIEEVSRHRYRKQRRRRGMRLDRGHEVGGPPVVQKEHPLSDAPQRRRPELVAAGLTLADVVRE